MEQMPERREMRIKPYKRDFTYSYAEGVFPTVELMEHAPETAMRVIVSEKGLNNSGVAVLQEKCCAFHVPFCTDDQTLRRICPKGSVLAAGIFAKQTRALDFTRSHVVLVNPSDMGNAGTIFRTAAAFGIFDVAVIEPAADYYDPKTIRASMGAFFRLRVCSYPTFQDYYDAAAQAGARDYFPFMLKGADMDAYRIPAGAPENPRSFVFGNESRGLEDAFLQIGTPLRISHLDTVDSLNLPTAVGIALHWQYQAFYSPIRSFIHE